VARVFTLDDAPASPAGPITAGDVDAAFDYQAEKARGVDPELDKQIERYSTMPSKQTPFKAAAWSLNPKIPGHPEYDDEGKSAIGVLKQEREAQSKRSAGKARVFTLDDEPVQKPKPEEASLAEINTLNQKQFAWAKDFYDKLTKGGWEGAYKEGVPNQIFERMTDVKSAEIEMQNDKLQEKEIERRKAAGESTSWYDMAQWRALKINEIIASHKPKPPQQTASEMWDAVKQAAVDDPKGFIAETARGFILHPELAAMPEMLPVRIAKMAETVTMAARAGERAAKAAGTVAHTAADAAQIGAASAAESGLAQAVNTGEIDPTRAAFEGATAAVPVVAMRVLKPREATQVRMAADLAVAKAAKEKGVEPSSVQVDEVVKQTDEKVAQGMPLQQAQREAMEAVGVSPEAAEDAAKMVPEPVKAEPTPTREPEPKVEAKGESHAVEERPVEEGDKPEHQRVDAPREQAAEPQADRGDRAPPSGEVPKEEPGKVVSLDDFRKQIGTTKAIDRELRQELGSVLSDAEKYVSQGRLPVEKVLDVIKKGGRDYDSIADSLAELLQSVEAPRGGVRPLSMDEIKAKAEAERGKPLFEEPKKKVPPGQSPLPEGVPNRFVTVDEQRRIYESAGFDEMALTAKTPIAMGAFRRRLAHRMAGEKFADGLLKDAAARGVFDQTPETAKAAVVPKGEVVIPSPSTAAADTPAPTQAATNLRQLIGEIGWAEKGGRILREQPKTIEEMRDKDFRGDVVGRTKWVPLSDFWPGRPDKKLTQRQAEAAINKAIAGEQLTPIERRFIDYANEELKFREGEVRKSAEAKAEIDREAAEERLAIQEENFKQGKEVGAVDTATLATLGITAAAGAGALIYTKDPKKAVMTALAVGGLAAVGLLFRRGIKANADLFDHLNNPAYRAIDTFRDYWKTVRSGQLATARFSWQLEALVKNEKARQQVTHWLQGDKSIKLTPEQHQIAAAVEEYFKTMGDKGQKAGQLPKDLLDDYVTQFWTGLRSNEGIVRNLLRSLAKNNTFDPGMSPKSRFAMQRVIPSYKEGMAQGMVPTTLDIAKIVRIYGDNLNKAIANKNLIAALKRDKTSDGKPFVIRDTPDEIAHEIAKTAAIVDKQWEGGGKIAEDIRKFAITKAPREYVTINHPQMRGLKVHQDIAPVMEWMFAAPPHAVTRMAYAAAVAAKRGIFSYSLFHVKALADAMAGTSVKGWVSVGKSILNPVGLTGPGAYQFLRKGTAGDVVDLLVSNGMNVLEKPLEGDITPFSNALKLLQEKNPIIGAPAKGMLIVAQAMDTFLWSTVHPTFKTAAGMAAFEKVLKDSTNPSLAIRMSDKVLGKRKTELSRAEAARITASYVNDIFGSLDWFTMAHEVQNAFGRRLALAVTSPQGRRMMQIATLAPDWTIATTRAMAKAIPGISQREIAALHQGYVVRSALLVLTVMNGLNYAFSGHSLLKNQDKTMVDLGDGRKLQFSKHFMEPIHWILNPWQQALNKLGWVIKEPIEQGMNKQWLSEKGAPPIATTKKDEDPVEAFVRRTGQRVGHAAGSVLPITGQTAYDLGLLRLDPDLTGLTPTLAGFFGFPIYGKTDEQYVRAAGERAESAGKDRAEAEKRATKRREREKKKREEAARPERP
jgi:hypothetical protein